MANLRNNHKVPQTEVRPYLMSNLDLNARQTQVQENCDPHGRGAAGPLIPAWTRIIFSLLIVLAPVFAQALEPDCKCEPMKCSECMIPQDQPEFYTAPCAEGKKVKSCARQKCVAIKPPPSQCVQKSASDTPIQKINPEASIVLSSDPSDLSSEAVGTVHLVTGEAWLLGRKADPMQLQANNYVLIGESIETKENGRVRVIFNDRNVLTVTPNTHVTIDDYTIDRKFSKLKEANEKISRMIFDISRFLAGPTTPIPGSSASSEHDSKKRDSGLSRVSLNLMRGKIRNMVNNSYKDNSQNYFRVKTPAAVAGVRGTDFVSAYDVETGDARVDTLLGAVNIEPMAATKTYSGNQDQIASDLNVVKGESILLTRDVSENKNSISWSWKKRQLTTAEQIRIRKETNWTIDEAEKLSKLERPDAPICSKPAAKFNTCQWVCKGNPEGESKCRTDLKGVACIRSRCNANGMWAEQSRVPVSSGRSCDGMKSVLAPCDY
jgi:hypothetical protein